MPRHNAPAKINLMLHVTGKRADGYHLLQSLVMFAEMGDDVVLNPHGKSPLHITGPFADGLSAEDNLVRKAAAKTGKENNPLMLYKNLPIGAGLGGGSSDAAATLRLLGSDIPISTLHTIAASLGSDVPACLFGKPCWLEGVGEKITPIDIAFDIPALLVNPGKIVTTQAVYQALSSPYDTPISLPASFASLEALLAFLHTTHNTLEPPARTLEPAIGEVLAALAELPHCTLARMSGSGATCFGIFPSTNACEEAARRLQHTFPHWWIQPTLLKGFHG